MTNLDSSKLFLEVIPRTMRNVRAEIRKFAADEFTTPQYRLLAKVHRQPASNQELADWLGVSAPTISKMIDKLVERGLVNRESLQFGSDRRQIRITATPEGSERVARVSRAVQRSFAKRLAALPEPRRRELIRGLNVLQGLFL
jgi:DNA-binding MarR family transcriptional regulator